MSKKVDDETTAPSGYKYSWSAKKDTDLSLDEFVQKYKPSVLTDDGSKPWIWIYGPNEITGNSSPESMLEAIAEAKERLKLAAERVGEIQNDASIPTRGSKKTQVKTKKEVREEVQGEARDALRDIAEKKKFTIGKWLIYAGPDSVDRVWSKIARSLADGPLSRTTAMLAKVSTSKSDQQASQHVICVYLPDIFDKSAATKVLATLIEQHNVTPTGAKPDLYTYIELDSKHPSGIRSTVWQPKECLSEAEMTSLRELFQQKAAPQGGEAMSATKAPETAPKQPPAKKHKEESDEDRNPFLSDSEKDEKKTNSKANAEAQRRAAIFSKPTKSKATTAATGSEGSSLKEELSATESEPEEPVAKKRKVQKRGRS